MSGTSYPIQSELVDAVISFANLDLKNSTQIRESFSGAWRPDALPSLRTCRDVQRETREWLSAPNLRAYLAMEGFDQFVVRIERGIRFEGRLNGVKGHRGKIEIQWKWWVSEASLRAICGLAVATIEQLGLRDRLAVCARPGCGLYFIDRESRGVPRKYCKTEACEQALNRERRVRSYHKTKGTK